LEIIAGTLLEDVHTFMAKSRLILLGKKCQTKAVDKMKKNFMLHNLCPENRDVYEIMWKNIVEPDRTQMTV